MSDVVRRYYDGSVMREWERLDNPYRRFELVSTLRLIEEFFPKSGKVIDIGGGPGRYTIELLKMGYSELGLTAELIAADARDLSMIESSSFDGALILGPLYHIVDEEGRSAALTELKRILKPGEPAIVGFINPWGIIRSGLTEFPKVYTDYERAAALLSTCI